MDKLILTDGIKSKDMYCLNDNIYHLFNRLVESIGNKRKSDTFLKPTGYWKRYEQRDANDVLVQCSFWFR